MSNKEEKIEYTCDVCEDKGYYMKTEWIDTDKDYEVMVRCTCTYD